MTTASPACLCCHEIQQAQRSQHGRLLPQISSSTHVEALPAQALLVCFYQLLALRRLRPVQSGALVACKLQQWSVGAMGRKVCNEPADCW
jgi:hypothetical protein